TTVLGSITIVKNKRDAFILSGGPCERVVHRVGVVVLRERSADRKRVTRKGVAERLGAEVPGYRDGERGGGGDTHVKLNARQEVQVEGCRVWSSRARERERQRPAVDGVPGERVSGRERAVGVDPCVISVLDVGTAGVHRGLQVRSGHEIGGRRSCKCGQRITRAEILSRRAGRGGSAGQRAAGEQIGAGCGGETLIVNIFAAAERTNVVLEAGACGDV